MKTKRERASQGTTIAIPETLHSKAKAEAEARGMTVKNVSTVAFETFLTGMSEEDRRAAYERFYARRSSRRPRQPA